MSHLVTPNKIWSHLPHLITLAHSLCDVNNMKMNFQFIDLPLQVKMDNALYKCVPNKTYCAYLGFRACEFPNSDQNRSEYATNSFRYPKFVVVAQYRAFSVTKSKTVRPFSVTKSNIIRAKAATIVPNLPCIARNSSENWTLASRNLELRFGKMDDAISQNRKEYAESWFVAPRETFSITGFNSCT